MPRDEEFSEEELGNKDQKLWAGRKIPGKVKKFLADLEHKSLEDIRAYIGDYFVAEDSTHGWLQYINEIEIQPARPIGRRGNKVFKVDMSFKNPIVQQDFKAYAYQEFRKLKAKKDPITQLAEELGEEDVRSEFKTRKPFGGGHL